MLKKAIGFVILFPIYSFANPIAFGHEGNLDANSNNPLIIQKNSDGTWSKNPNISGLPHEINRAFLSKSSCFAHYCVITGNYPKNAKSFPLLLLSRDYGQSWYFINKISGIPDSVKEVNIYSLHCANNVCMAVGAIHDGKRGNDHQRPLLLMSSNNGDSWAVSNAGLVNLTNKTDGQLHTVIKSNQNWMASGYYYYPHHFPSPILSQTKLFMISHDNGLSWRELNIEGGPIIPPAKGLLFDLKCMDNFCIQLGTGDKLQPFIARTEDGGNTWKRIKDISGIPATWENPILDKLSCYHNFCVATNSGWDNMFILISHDKGISWTTAKEIVNIPENFKSGNIKQVSCLNDKMCSAIGWWRNNVNDFQFFPMLLITHDGGESWSYQSLPFIHSTDFNSVECRANICHIIGKSGDSPLILTSQDQGQTWHLQTEIFGLPSNSNSVLFSFLNNKEN